jgi:hypothetical protein
MHSTEQNVPASATRFKSDSFMKNGAQQVTHTLFGVLFRNDFFWHSAEQNLRLCAWDAGTSKATWHEGHVLLDTWAFFRHSSEQ